MRACLSVIVPAHNEARTIERLIERVLASPAVCEVVVVDDGSDDDTKEILERLARLPKVKVVSHDRNRGKGAAIRSGMQHVTGEFVIIQDADLEYDPADYEVILREFEHPDVSVVYGSRRLLKTNPMSSLTFYMGGVTLSWLTNLLYGTRITDAPTCYKAFRTGLLKSLPLTCNGFEFCPEVTARILNRGIRIREVAITYHPRTVREGKKVSWKDGVKAFWTLFKYRFLERETPHPSPPGPLSTSGEGEKEDRQGGEGEKEDRQGGEGGKG